ncbi:MAG TPA: DUF2723 domain-containing protein [Methylomirabilota bacterium]|nr:DUF2723 domain-containing protein [Methylomirabilota bacterium]
MDKPKRGKDSNAGTPGRQEPLPSETSPNPPAPAVGFLGRFRSQLVRAGEDAWVGGVCGGLARRTSIPVWVWRVIFLALTPLAGLGAVLYALCCVVFPAERGPSAPGLVQPLYRRIDWITCGVSTLVMFVAYFLTLAPDVTLEDAGELAVASDYAGVPHPPGYPVWTLYTWVFTWLVPFSNIAWRVGLSSAVAAAAASGLLGLIVSRGSSMIIEGIGDLKSIERRWENRLCFVSGFVAALLLGFNGFMWSQAVIVEVYTLSVLSFMGVLCLLLRWIYAPHQRRYLYWAFFLFGICFTNHQTLIVAAMGIQVAIALAQPRLGRDLLFANTLVFALGVLGYKLRAISAFQDPMDPTKAGMLFVIFSFVGVLSVAGWFYLVLWTGKTMRELVRDALGVLAVGYPLLLLGTITNYVTFWEEARHGAKLFVLVNMIGLAAIGGCLKMLYETRKLGKEWVVVIGLATAWFLGAAFYFYMPLSSMTNPPLNWGYPRTAEGFVHAFTRGQYDRIKPTDNPGQFVRQAIMYAEEASKEFHWVFLLIGLVPFFYLRRMRIRERAWLIGLAAIYFGLAVILLWMLNPGLDNQSRGLTKVFFTSSHMVISMAIGYGLAITGAALLTQYREARLWVLCGSAAAAGIGLFAVAQIIEQTYGDWSERQGVELFFYALGQSLIKGQNFLPVFAGVFVVALAVVLLVAVLVRREKAPMALVLSVFACLPVSSISSHWADNEQRGHLFGYWFGHDMFTPPFDVYPEMARDAILFGGTDPGRFNPTYMIFSESFIPASKKRDPEFDRRDVYLITQNALADKTYLDYIRAHYNRSTQVDPPFFRELLRGPAERAKDIDAIRGNEHTNVLARIVAPLDRLFTDLGARIEADRRARGVYPPEEINTPTPEDSQIAFQQYLEDAGRRERLGQLKPGEDVRRVRDDERDERSTERIQVSGQVAVMSINGILTRIIFDKNPDHEFYVEESFPLDWMFPHLTPFGIIMKINREPLTELTAEVLEKDHRFWRAFSGRLTGDWITYDTTVEEICEFAERVYLRKDFTGFEGDPRFLRDDNAQKAFSKLRSAIAGIYAWRLGLRGAIHTPPQYRAGTPEQEQRLLQEAEFAYKQAFAFCPYSPEAVYNYVQMLATHTRFDEALALARTAAKFDPHNRSIVDLIQQLEQFRNQQEVAGQMRTQLPALEQNFRSNPSNVQIGIQLASAYLQVQQNDKAVEVLDQIVDNPAADSNVLLSIAQVYAQLQHRARLERALLRLTAMMPQNPEAWYELALVQTGQGKHAESIESLKKAMETNARRLQANPAAADLKQDLRTNTEFGDLRAFPEFQELVAP